MNNFNLGVCAIQVLHNLQARSIFNDAAAADDGKNKELFEYEDEKSYNDLLQKAIDSFFPKQPESKAEFSIKMALENFWRGFKQVLKNPFNRF